MPRPLFFYKIPAHPNQCASSQELWREAEEVPSPITRGVGARRVMSGVGTLCAHNSGALRISAEVAATDPRYLKR